MYPTTCLRSASGPCMQSRTEGFSPLPIKTLYTTVPVFRPASSVSAVFRPVTGHKIIPPCHSRIKRRMAAILAPLATLATRAMSRKLRNMIPMPMRLKQNQMTTAVKRKHSTGNPIRTSTRQLKNPRGSASVRMLSLKLLSVVLIRTTMSVVFLTLTSCSGTVVGAVGAASRILAFHGSLFRHGTKILYPQMIIKERLPELWQNLCMIPRPRSP
jgi:hypothetical protein